MLIEHDKDNRRVNFCGLWISEARAWMLLHEYRRDIERERCGNWSRSIADRYDEITANATPQNTEAKSRFLDIAIRGYSTIQPPAPLW